MTKPIAEATVNRIQNTTPDGHAEAADLIAHINYQLFRMEDEIDYRELMARYPERKEESEARIELLEDWLMMLSIQRDMLAQEYGLNKHRR